MLGSPIGLLLLLAGTFTVTHGRSSVPTPLQVELECCKGNSTEVKCCVQSIKQGETVDHCYSLTSQTVRVAVCRELIRFNGKSKEASHGAEYEVNTTKNPIKEEEEDDIHSMEVAKKCCSLEERHCCYEAIHFRRPLIGCVREDSLVKKSLCVQKTIFPEKKEAHVTNITDLSCCRFFEGTVLDPSNQCVNTCATVLSSPSMEPHLRLKLINHCSRRNRLYKCFDQCVNLRRKGLQLKRHCGQVERDRTTAKPNDNDW